MSATSAPFGFRAIFHPSGTIRPECFQQPTIPAAAVYKGDPVKLTGANATGTVNICGDTDAPIGIFDGCEYIDSNGVPQYSPYWPASLAGVTGIKWYVITDPLTVFEAQGAGTIAATAIGDSCDSTIAAGNTNTGVSGTVLKSGTLAGAATAKTWRIMSLGQQIDNAWGDSYTIVRVKMALQQTISTPASI